MTSSVDRLAESLHAVSMDHATVSPSLLGGDLQTTDGGESTTQDAPQTVLEHLRSLGCERLVGLYRDYAQPMPVGQLLVQLCELGLNLDINQTDSMHLLAVNMASLSFAQWITVLRAQNTDVVMLFVCPSCVVKSAKPWNRKSHPCCFLCRPWCFLPKSAAQCATNVATR